MHSFTALLSTGALAVTVALGGTHHVLAQMDTFPPAETAGATFTVNSSRDHFDNNLGNGYCETGFFISGNAECTLRAAIQEANATAGTDHIEIWFDFVKPPPPGYDDGYDAVHDRWTITPDTSGFGRLPTIKRPNVHIHAETQAGSSGFDNAQCAQLVDGRPHTIKVFLDGKLVETSALIEGLLEFEATAPGGSVRGLAIGNAKDRGILIEADFVAVECVYVGTYWGGDVRAQNFIGIDASGTQYVSVRNSLAAGNSSYGIELASIANGTIIEGNLIGTDVTGTSILTNGTGIEVVAATNVRIGGIDPFSWNLISGNTSHGVILGSASPGAVIEGNRIGTNLAGDAPLPNGFDGIRDYATGTRIGGLAESAGNLVSGNSMDGLGLFGQETIVEGNRIGINLAGNAAIANANGVNVEGNHVRIGGLDPAARNVISGNTGDGIGLADTANVVLGNYIGTDVAGSTAIPNGWGVFVTAPDNTIGGEDPAAGNLISGNGTNGIEIIPLFPSTDASGNTIVGNRIGTNADGTGAVPNVIYGIRDLNDNSNPGRWTRIVGNVISGNLDTGIRVESATKATRILGNLIGVTIDGTSSLANGGGGVYVAGDEVQIGGESPEERNVISGHALSAGVYITPAASYTAVYGNYVGTDITGMVHLPNNVSVNDHGQFTEIGGATPASGNLISDTVGSSGSGASIQNNKIGVNAAGIDPIGNASLGIHEQGQNTLIFGNQISGNGGGGIFLNGAANGCVISKNRIGTDPDGVAPVPNGSHGIHDTGSGTAIGSSIPGNGNTIAFNAGAGIVLDTNPTETTIMGNAIHQNVGLGIDIGDDGVTSNDLLDVDGGPNDGQNFPDNLTASSDGTTTTIGFRLQSTPASTFRIQVFSNALVDPSGYGEGERLVWTDDVTTDGSGGIIVSGVGLPTSEVPIGSWLTATATQLVLTNAESTSEFSPAIQVEGPQVHFAGRLWLEGPYASGMMSVGSQYETPINQPYSSPAFDGTLMDYDGPEAVFPPPPGAIDWIVLSLRRSPAAHDEVVRRVAYVTDVGDIVDLSGASELAFPGVTTGDYHVVACHRNHGCVMSSVPVPFPEPSSGEGTWFFTIPGAAYPGLGDETKHLGGGEYGMYGGDSNLDLTVQTLDFNRTLRCMLLGLKGYLPGDYDLSGECDLADLESCVDNTRLGARSRVPE